MTNKTRHLMRIVALATAITAIAAPAASAAPAEQLLPSSGEERLPWSAIGEARSFAPVDSTNTSTADSASGTGPALAASDGFDWGDAGIGASAMLAVATMVAGAMLVVRNRPRPGSAA